MAHLGCKETDVYIDEYLSKTKYVQANSTKGQVRLEWQW